jgi:hypothetical protein
MARKTPPPVPTLSRQIDLTPGDWMRATWRPRQPVLDVPMPAARELTGEAFDLEAALQLAAQRFAGRPSFRVQPYRSREEAHFWFWACTQPEDHVKPKAPPLSEGVYDGHPTLDDLEKRLVGWSRPWNYGDAVLRALEVLLTPGQILHFLRRAPGWTRPRVCLPDAPYPYWPARVMQWFTTNVFPHIADEDIEAVRPLLRDTMRDHPWSTDSGEFSDPTWLLAGFVGLHKELLAVVESWPDNRYVRDHWSDSYHQPWYPVFGLGSAELVATHFRRLRLSLETRDHVRAWLAHTEVSALDYVRDCILANTWKPGVELLTESLTLVKAPEVAQAMLELRLSSRAPLPARVWLDDQTAHAIVGLVPVAAARGELAEEAVEFLREAYRAGHAALIEEQVKQAPSTVTAAVRKLVLKPEKETPPPLDDAAIPTWLRPTLKAAGAKAERLPAWVVSETLPPVVVGDHRLNDVQVRLLLAALKKSPLGAPVPLVAQLLEHADRDSLEAFAWRLCRRWLAEDAPAKEKWALIAVGHLGGDATAAKLAPLLETWQQDGQTARAKIGVESLHAIGTKTARTHLEALAGNKKLKGLQKRAQQLLGTS